MSIFDEHGSLIFMKVCKSSFPTFLITTPFSNQTKDFSWRNSSLFFYLVCRHFTPNLPELLGRHERYDVFDRIPDNGEVKIPTTQYSLKSQSTLNTS